MLLFRLKVTSRKLMIFLLASMVMRSPFSLKTRQISFLMFSVALGNDTRLSQREIFNYLSTGSVITEQT